MTTVHNNQVDGSECFWVRSPLYIPGHSHRGRFVRLLALAASRAISNQLFSPAFFPLFAGTIATIRLLLCPFAGSRTVWTTVARKSMKRIE